MLHPCIQLDYPHREAANLQRDRGGVGGAVRGDRGSLRQKLHDC